MQRVDVLNQKLMYPFIGFIDNMPDFSVDFHGSCFAVIFLRGHFTAEEYLFILLAEGYRTEFFAHAPLTYHFTGNIRRPFDVVSGAGCLAAEDDLLGRPTSHKYCNPVKEGFPRVAVFVLDR